MQIVRNSQQEITDLSEDQIRTLKDSLTYDNPAYQSAKKIFSV